MRAMRRYFAILACSTVLAAGPCAVESWSVAVAPGLGDRESFIGVELDFGDMDLVLPLIPFEN